MSSIKGRPYRIPTSASTVYTPGTGFTRPPATTLSVSPQVGGVLPRDVLAGVDSVVLSIATPAIGATADTALVQTLPFPALPTLRCSAQEQPILIVTASASSATPGLVFNTDVTAQTALTNSALPVVGAYLPKGASTSGYAARIALFLQTNGAPAAPGTLQIRANAELYVRRLT